MIGLPRGRGWLAFALFAVAALTPSAAAGAFTPANNFSDADLDGTLPQVASDGSGGGFVVWQQGVSELDYQHVKLRTISSSGVRGPEQDLSGSVQAAYEPRIASSPSGDAVVVWYGNNGGTSRIRARQISAAGVVGPLENISPAGEGAYVPDVGVDADGNAVVAWYTGAGVIKARSFSAASVLGPVRTLSPAGGNGSQVDVGSAAGGGALVAWTHNNGSPTGGILARLITAAGGSRPLLNLAPAGNQGLPDVAADANGDAVVVWQRQDGAGDFRVLGRTVSAAGALGTVSNLSAAGETAGAARVATDPGGDSFATWVRFDGAVYRVQERQISAAGALGTVRNVTGPGQEASSPRVAVEADGDAVAAWLDYASGRTAQARTISAGGVFGALQTISADGVHYRDPQIATDPDGGAVVAWSRWDGEHYRVQAAVGP